MKTVELYPTVACQEQIEAIWWKMSRGTDTLNKALEGDTILTMALKPGAKAGATIQLDRVNDTIMIRDGRLRLRVHYEGQPCDAWLCGMPTPHGKKNFSGVTLKINVPETEHARTDNREPATAL